MIPLLTDDGTFLYVLIAPVDEGINVTLLFTSPCSS